MSAMPAPQLDLSYTLDDKYTRQEGRIFPVSYTHLTLPTIYSV